MADREVSLHGGPLHGFRAMVSPDAWKSGVAVFDVIFPPMTVEDPGVTRSVKYTRVRGARSEDFECVGSS